MKNENVKVKTPKLKDTDRRYLLKTENTLIVRVYSFAASCRYGANTKWCISTPSEDYYWSKYTNERVYMVIINKGLPTEYKFCFIVSKRSPNFKIWGSDNCILSEYIFNAVAGAELLHIIKADIEKSTKRYILKANPFKVGDVISPNPNLNGFVVSFTSVSVNKFVEGSKRIPYYALNIKLSQIERAEVVLCGKRGLHFKILKLKKNNFSPAFEKLVCESIFNGRTFRDWTICK